MKATGLCLCIIVHSVVAGDASNATQDVPSFSDGVKVGIVKSRRIKEAASICASKRHAHVLYTHDDIGGKHRIFAIDATSGHVVATINISGAEFSDLEDIACGPCPGLDGPCVYIGDTGSLHGGANIIYRIREPDTLHNNMTVDLDDFLKFSWDQYDCETLLVDNLGEVYIVSKASYGRGQLVRLPSNAWGNHSHVLLEEGVVLPLHANHWGPLGGDISPDGTKVLMKLYNAVLYWYVPNGDYYSVLSRSGGIDLPYHVQPHGKAVCWDAKGAGYFTLGKGRMTSLYYYTLDNVPSFSDGVNVGIVKNRRIKEASGICASRRHAHVLYTHNDSGGTHRIFAIDATYGHVIATINIAGAVFNDWEDIACGPCPGLDGTCVYIADTGSLRGGVNIIYRIREPDTIEDNMTVDLDDFLKFSWEEYDCETLLVDNFGEVYIVSKARYGLGNLVRLPSNAWGNQSHVLLEDGVFLPLDADEWGPVGGDISPDGTEVLLKMYSAVLYWYVPDGDYYSCLSRSSGFDLPYQVEPQGEAVCWDAEGAGYFTLGEGHRRPLYYYSRNNGTVQTDSMSSDLLDEQ